MKQNNADYTNTFLFLMKEKFLKDKLFQDSMFRNWYHQWQERLKQNKKPLELSLNLMRSVNPLIIPRNHNVEEVLKASTIYDDLSPMHNLLKVLKNPYNNQSEITTYQHPPEPSDQVYKTFCGT